MGSVWGGEGGKAAGSFMDLKYTLSLHLKIATHIFYHDVIAESFTVGSVIFFVNLLYGFNYSNLLLQKPPLSFPLFG